MFCRKGVLRSFAKFTGKHLCQGFFFNKFAGLRPAILLKMRLWHRYFLVNFGEFLRGPFLTKHLRWLLLYLAFFSLQLADTINNFKVILAVREKEYKKQFVKCFLNVIYFRHLEISIFESSIGQSFLGRKNDIELEFPFHSHLHGLAFCGQIS